MGGAEDLLSPSSPFRFVLLRSAIGPLLPLSGRAESRNSRDPPFGPASEKAEESEFLFFFSFSPPSLPLPARLKQVGSIFL